MWFRETKPEREEGSKKPPYDLNVYYFAPYNRTEENGGMKQYDHLSQFIHAIYLDFLKTKNLAVLRLWRKLGISCSTDDFLLYSERTLFAGPDQIKSHVLASYTNAYWYLSTNNLTKMAKTLGKMRDAGKLKVTEKIKQRYSEVFYSKVTPGAVSRVGLAIFGRGSIRTSKTVISSKWTLTP